MLGLIVAAVGIALGVWLGIPEMDGIASIVIGVILAVTAILLAYECKELLVGESAVPATVKRIKRLLESERRVRRVNEVLTMHLGPTDVLLNISVDLKTTWTPTTWKMLSAAWKCRLRVSFRK